MLCLCLLPACGDSNGDEPDNPNPINPDKEVADPAGTVKLSMRSEAAVGDSKTTINNGLWIDAADNFYAHRGYIVNLGSMKGLGNVGYIPKTGYVETVAVTPGDGYIWATEGYNEFGNYERNTFYRIYVTNYTQNTSGEIIGADIKYQKPFYGKDEALKPSDTNLSVSGDGGEASVVFENNSVIPFVVESDKDWVRPSISSTLDHSFLPNAITFYIDPATTTESETATVTATTYYDKSTTITITRLGVAPKLSIPDDAANKEIDANATEYRLPITTNLDFNDLTLKSSADWATVELVDGSSRTAAIANSIRWIGNEPATHSRANTATVRTYYALVKVAENKNNADRTATITISDKEGKLSATQKLKQEKASFSIEGIDGSTTLYADREVTVFNFIVKGNLPYTIKSDSEEWCSIYQNGENLSINLTSTTETRNAKVTITSANEPIVLTIKQSKWKNQDYYDNKHKVFLDTEKGKGIMYCTPYHNHDNYNTNYCQWSVREIATGATSLYDGEANTNKIKSINGWEELFPVLALAEKHNKETNETGWYLPALAEIIALAQKCDSYYRSDYWWTSSEKDITNTYQLRYLESNIAKKTEGSGRVVLFKKFNAFDVEDE